MSIVRRFTARAVMALGVACVASPSLFAALIPAERREPAPAFELTDSHGALVKLGDYRGRVVLLNFWATWCHGCKREIPWFVKFAKGYRTNGLGIIGVSMDKDGWKSVNRYLRKKKLNYPVVIGSKSLADAYGLVTMPRTILIDKEGRIAAAYSGVVDRASCEKEIQTLTTEPVSR